MARRSLLGGAALGVPVALTASVGMPLAAQAEPAATSGSVIKADAATAIAPTEAGQVAGYVEDDLFIFKGVPYGASTAGEHRFMPPRPPTPWTGVRSSRHYGPVAPQDKGAGRFNDEEAFIFQWNDSVESEDCLRLNIWSPGLGSQGRRPVLVWLHGGGFAAGSGHDIAAFDGRNLAREGDAVVVSLNHRLNLLGFLDLSMHGERYAQSANVGMLDIVAALAWVRRNIAAFGGDPDCVTIFGQSGGGAKVSVLMGMPTARGLFHRAMVMSGSFAMLNTPQKSARLSALLLAELGIAPTDVERLHTLPYAQLRKASETVLARENAPFPGFVDVRRIPQRLDFAPTVDGATLPAAPFRPDAPALSAHVPMIIGTTLNEFVSGINQPDINQMSEADLLARAEAFEPGRGADIVAAFRKTTPEASPFDLWSRIATAPVRRSALEQAASKSAAGGAPAYVYRFDWPTPVLDGRPRAFHCLDIPFVFANTDRCASMTGGGAEARRLSKALSGALMAFARTGDPNHQDLPTWPAYDAASAPTLHIGSDIRVAFAADRQELASVA